MVIVNKGTAKEITEYLNRINYKYYNWLNE